MNYRDQVFLKVAENLSFSKAASELFISQPAVTNHIKALETDLKIRLLERKGNKVYLTKAGELVYRHLKKIKLAYRDLEFEIGKLNKTNEGKLLLGASSTISQYIIPKVIADFNKRYPEIKIFLTNGNSHQIEEKLLENELDLALVENDLSRQNIKYSTFLTDEVIAITGSKSIYSKINNITILDLQKIPIVLREEGSGTLEVIKKALKKQDVKIDNLNIIMRLGSTEAIKNFLQNFEGISLISEKSVEREIFLKLLSKINIKGLDINRHLRIALRHGENNSISNTFIDFLFHYNF